MVTTSDGASQDASGSAALAGSPVTIGAAERPLEEIVERIREVAGMEIDFAQQETGDRRVSLSVKDVPWTAALDLALDRTGCTSRPSHGGGLVIEPTIPVSREWTRADVREVIETIAGTAGVRAHIDAGVRGRITFTSVDLPWRHALEAVAAIHGATVIDEPDGSVRVAAAE